MKRTEGVKTLLGDPRKAIIKLSGPMVIALFVQSLYNLADAVWVAGLGSDALSAIGMFFPVFMIIMALASGVGLGGSSAISRKIGARDKELADQAAIHTLIFGMGLIVTVSLLIYPFLSQIFRLMGAEGEVLTMVVGYARILVLGSVFLVYNNIVNGILRGEGDTRRAMIAMTAGSLLNIFLDPLFIYGFKLGVNGAAWATLFSIIVTGLIMSNWLFLRRDTFVSVRPGKFRFNGKLLFEILRVGIPSSFGQIAMASTVFILNVMVGHLGGSEGIAVFTAAWRIILIGVIPLMGIAIGVTAVTAAAYGEKNYEKLKTGYLFGVRIGFLSELVVSLVIFIFAKQVSYIFTYSKGAVHLLKPLVRAMRILIIFVPFVPLGMLTSSLFQGIGKGEYSLAIMILRTVIFQLFFAYLFGYSLGYGLTGVWSGITTGNVLASSLAISWGLYYISLLRQRLMRP